MDEKPQTELVSRENRKYYYKKSEEKRVLFQVGNEIIPPVQAVKYLGVWINDRLMFNEDIKRTLVKDKK